MSRGRLFFVFLAVGLLIHHVQGGPIFPTLGDLITRAPSVFAGPEADNQVKDGTFDGQGFSFQVLDGWTGVDQPEALNMGPAMLGFVTRESGGERYTLVVSEREGEAVLDHAGLRAMYEPESVGGRIVEDKPFQALGGTGMKLAIDDTGDGYYEVLYVFSLPSRQIELRLQADSKRPDPAVLAQAEQMAATWKATPEKP